jgi:methylenetetrahydrofolate dehydrogenase (NADP+) / methenyltetrahydrofolate cyclohydrolase
MVATIADCSIIASKYEKELEELYSGLEGMLGFVTIITGQEFDRDGTPTMQKPSWNYVRNIGEECKKYGIKHEPMLRDTDDALKITINKLNNYHSIDGILVLSPHPPSITIDRHDLANMVIAHKDVEGLSSYHKGKLEQKHDGPSIVPPTAGAIMAILDHYGYEFKDHHAKNALIINRSEVLGKPLRNLLEHKGMTVIATDINTDDKLIKDIMGEIDLIVTAVPSNTYRLPVKYVRKGSVVIAVNSHNIRNTPESPYHDVLMGKCALITDHSQPLGKITRKITLLNLYKLAMAGKP